jgi:hypothetical protein
MIDSGISTGSLNAAPTHQDLATPVTMLLGPRNCLLKKTGQT